MNRYFSHYKMFCSSGKCHKLPNWGQYRLAIFPDWVGYHVMMNFLTTFLLFFSFLSFFLSFFLVGGSGAN